MAPKPPVNTTSTLENLISSVDNSTIHSNSTILPNPTITPSPPKLQHQDLVAEYLLIILGFFIPVVMSAIVVLIIWCRKRISRPEGKLSSSLARDRIWEGGYSIALLWRMPLEVIEGGVVGRRVEGSQRVKREAVREPVGNREGEQVEVHLRSPIPEMNTGDNDAVERRVIEWNGGREDNQRDRRRDAGLWSNWARDLQAEVGVGEVIELGEIPPSSGERQEPEEEENEPEQDHRNQNDRNQDDRNQDDRNQEKDDESTTSTSSDISDQEAETQGDGNAQQDEVEQSPLD